MGLITKEVTSRISGNNYKHYEALGYEIPKRFNDRGVLKPDITKNITVKTYDLSKGSAAQVDVQCDRCCKTIKMEYRDYIRYNHDGLYYCNYCKSSIFANKISYGIKQSKKHKVSKLSNNNMFDNSRTSPEYKHFVKTVLYRDRFTCRACGNDNPNSYEVHHLNGYSWDVNNRMNPDNGVCLCSTCHKNYHLKYGNSNAKKEDFFEWLGVVKLDIIKYDGNIPTTKKVYCIDNCTIYDSAEDAAKYIGNKNSSSRIYEACDNYSKRRDNKSAKKYKGYHFMWLSEYENATVDEVNSYVEWCDASINKRKVRCVETNEVYKSISDAIKLNGFNKTASICYACRTGGSCCGYHWEYAS